jgi:putative membrane protein
MSCPNNLDGIAAAPAPWMMGSGMSGMMLLMAIGWLVVVGAVAAGIWWLLNRRRRAADVALDVLRERYARGEITREEFENKRRDLAA